MLVSAAVIESIRVWWTENGWKENGEMSQSGHALPAFPVLWMVVSIAFFSLSASKLPGYILPALPAGTMLLAEYARRHVVEDDRPSLLLIVMHSTVAALPVVAALMMQDIVLQHRLPWGRVAAISFGLAAGLAPGIALTLRHQSGLRVLCFITLVPVLLAVVGGLRPGRPALVARPPPRPQSQGIQHVGNST